MQIFFASSNKKIASPKVTIKGVQVLIKKLYTFAKKIRYEKSSLGYRWLSVFHPWLLGLGLELGRRQNQLPGLVGLSRPPFRLPDAVIDDYRRYRDSVLDDNQLAGRRGMRYEGLKV
jgi:hypothetical protein